jgi:hypothetical protein
MMARTRIKYNRLSPAYLNLPALYLQCCPFASFFLIFLIFLLANCLRIADSSHSKAHGPSWPEAEVTE